MTTPDLNLVTRRLTPPVLVIHGGAGRHERGGGDVEAGLGAALEAGWVQLGGGGSALDAVVAAVAAMEDSGLFNAGRGAVPTTAGTVETDAGVMGVLPDGREVSGAACAATWPANPIHLALEIARGGDALLLAGPGADRYAEAAGLRRRDDSSLTGGGEAPISAMGTVGAVALGTDGALAAATSTGGRRGQPQGRVGDTPIIGAGTWADQGRVAVSGTGDGEAFVRAGFGHLVDAAIAAGRDLPTAAAEALGAVRRWGGTGGAVMVAPGGELVALFDTESMAQGWRNADETVAQLARRG